VLNLAEILSPQPVERGAEHLGGAADEVMHLRLKGVAVPIVPSVGRDVAVVHEHRRRVPVLRLALEPIAALENEDALSRRGEMPRQSPTAGAAADDDDVEPLIHTHCR
jgi:hypothetical protein